ncbi:hypothetical protein [Microseira sp. BLCC-F43]
MGETLAKREGMSRYVHKSTNSYYPTETGFLGKRNPVSHSVPR